MLIFKLFCNPPKFLDVRGISIDKHKLDIDKLGSVISGLLD